MDSSKQSKKSLPSIHWLKLRAEGQWLRIVTSLCKIAPEQLDGRKQPCPLCGGADRFRAFRDFEEKGGVVCSHCHNKRNADGLATVAWLNGWPFPQTVRAIAELLGEVPPGKVVNQPSQRAQPAAIPSHAQAKQVQLDRPHPASAIKFLPWNASLAALWCLKKRPITPAALERIGARLARYHDSLIVISIPIWGPQLQQADPVGWLLFNATGGDLPSKDGPVSKKITWGSDTGVIGMVNRLRDPSARKIKTEGPTDLLSLLSVNPQTTDCIICNACGANEHPEKKMPWLGQMVAGSVVITVHDQDQAGRDGLERWSNFFAATAAQSRAMTLPFEFEQSHGKDLRDYFLAGASLADWESLIATSPLVAYRQPELAVLEHVEDPHRLARVNLHYYRTEHNGDIKYWRDQWMRWKKNRYKIVKESEMEAKVNQRIKREFNDHWKAEYEEYLAWQRSSEFDPDKDKGPPRAKKVTASIIRDTMKAMQSQCLLSGEIELGTWIDGREKRKYLACANGILDIQAFVNNQPLEQIFLKHSSSWFSTSCLDYDFDPNADCPTWLKYIDDVTDGNEAKKNLLQEFVGYILSPDNNRSKFLALEGDGGNGKSVFINGIQAIIGSQNMSSVSLMRLGERFGTFSTLGKMLNVCHESSDLESPAESALKQFTGSDPMSFEQKGRDPFEIKPTAKLIITWNEPPRFKDKTDALWRRLLVVRFERRIQNPNTQFLDPNFWVSTGEVAGMLNWALAGLSRLESQGFTEAKEMHGIIEDMRTTGNSARNFIKEHYEYAEGKKVACKAIYEQYSKWAIQNGHKAFNESHFGREVRSLYKTCVTREKHMTDGFDGRVWCYVNLRERLDYGEDSSNYYDGARDRVPLET